MPPGLRRNKTILNIPKDVYEKLEIFEAIVKSKLIESGLCHADEG